MMGDDAFSQLLASQVEEQNRFDLQFRQMQDDAFKRAEAARASATKSQLSGPAATPEVAKLVELLGKSPYLAPAVLRYAEKLGSDISEMIQQKLDAAGR